MNSSINSNNSSVLINSTLSFLLDFATNATTTTSSPPLLNFSLPTESSKENSQLSPPSSSSLLQSIPDQDYNHSQLSHLKCLPSPSASILFQLSHVLFLLAYLTPTNVLYLPGACGQLAMHSVLALGHLLLTIWVYSSTSGSCYRSLFPTLIGWSVAFFLVNSFRAAVLLYSAVVKNRLKVKEVASLYEDLFAPVRVSKRDFSKLISKGRLTELAIGESYAVEGVTETNRLALLVAGKINVMCAGQFLHSINPGEFLDSPEWESSTPSGSSVTGTSANNNCNGSSSKPSGTSGSAAGRKPSLSNNFVAVSTAGRYELFDGTTGKSGKEQFQAEVQQRFNISLIAATVNVQYVLWERPTLEYHLAKEPYMGTVMGLLLARDITNKLYQMNEKISNERGSQIDIRLPVIINSFSKRTDLTKFLPVTASSAFSARPRSLTSTTTTAKETPLKNVPKTSAAAAAAVAISPLATISTSSRRRGSSNEGQNTAESANYVLPAAVCQQKLNRESPATTTCSTTQTSHSITTTENSSSDEIFIDIAGKDSTPDEAPALKKFSISAEPVKKPEDTDEEEDEEDENEEEKEYSTSASYAAMSLSEAGSSNWAAPSTLNSIGSDQRSQQFGFRTKRGKGGGGVHQSPDSTAVNIPLLPKNVIGSSDKRRFY